MKFHKFGILEKFLSLEMVLEISVSLDRG
jgi:hypothetical protein